MTNPRANIWAVFFCICLQTGSVFMTPSVATEDEANAIETVVVYADFRAKPLAETPTSISVLDSWTLESAGRQHFEELITLVPNLNWSGGTSRPRYLQIRGIGERSQYQGAPNPSVGVIVDDIDFSGIGMVATLFDLEQVEVVRGPQGTRYGANALAGLINLRSNSTTDTLSGRLASSIGGDDARSLGLAISGPLGKNSSGPKARLALHRYRANGFRDNTFLGRGDTNARDETTARLKLDWNLGRDATVQLNTMFVDLDNGYDAFAIDNSLITLSDKPGKDSQRSRAFSLRAEWQASDSFLAQSITSAADSDIEFSFDGDWGNDRDWAPFDPYDFFSRTLRERRTYAQELRLISQPHATFIGGRTAWIAGVRMQRLEEANANEDLFNSEIFTALESDYAATNTALFAQLDSELSPVTTLSTGLRLEHRNASYRDSNGADFSPSETMLGGQVVLSRNLDDNLNFYLGVARGYKAGGFNIGTRIPDERREFDAEYLWNFETGLKAAWPAFGMRTNLGMFYMLRRDQQVSTSFQDDPNDPLSFTFFNDNAASGRNLGLEADFSWQANERWRLFGNIGLLHTRFDEYLTATRVLDGREQAHAPAYTFSLGTFYQHPRGVYGRIDISGKDSFYYSDSHDQQSRAYELVSMRLGWSNDRWDIYAWGNNIFDQVYTVRGFFFGNEPPDFPNKLYTRRGDPRIFGFGVDYRF